MDRAVVSPYEDEPLLRRRARRERYNDLLLWGGVGLGGRFRRCRERQTDRLSAIEDCPDLLYMKCAGQHERELTEVGLLNGEHHAVGREESVSFWKELNAQLMREDVDAVTLPGPGR